MPMVEIGLGLLCAVAGGGAGWLGRGKYEAKLRATPVQAKSERRKAGGQKAAATRKAKAEKAAEALIDKVPSAGVLEGSAIGVNGRFLAQRQQFQGGQVQSAPNGEAYARGVSGNGAVDESLYGRGEHQ